MPSRTTPEAVIRAQVVLEEHDMAAEGSFAVVVRRFVAADRYRSHLWLVPLDGGRPVQLTSGAVRDTGPRVAPDGSAVAFKRTAVPPRRAKAGAKDEEPQVLVLPLGPGHRAGRAWPVRVPKARAVGELAWAPDSQRLGLTIEAGPPRFIVGLERFGEEPAVRRIGRIDWRWDEAGYLDRWSHLHVVEARRGAALRQVTRGDWGVSHIAWAPDGRSIAYVADPRAGADVQPLPSVWTVAVDEPVGAEPREVLRLGGAAGKPAWSPDGRWLVAIGYVPPDAKDDEGPELVVGPSDGATPPWQIAPTLDRPIGAWNDTDLHGWIADSRATPCWVADGTIVAIVTDRGQAVPWRFDVDPSTARPIGEPRPLVTSPLTAYSLAGTGNPAVPRERRVTALAAVDGRPMELVTLPLDPVEGDAAQPAVPPRSRTTLGGRWANAFEWPRMTMVSAPGAGGPIETWVASPADSRPGPLPTIVDIHGGPLGCWGPAPSLGHLLLCARGYRVILPNIRGSTGYGRDWIRPQLGDWGGVDAADVHAAVDHAIALGLADPARLGVFGWSYGGFMVHWLLGTSERFRAGVSEAGVTNQISGWSESDSGVEYNRMARLGTPLDPEGMAGLWRQSPLAHASSIRAPLLILQGEADLRCPPSDNVQLFTALRVLGRTVELALYPEESHAYHAGGRPDRRIDRMTRMLDWFDRYVIGPSP